MEATDDPATITRPYAGETATHYIQLSELGLAPKAVDVTETTITAARHRTLEEWLETNPGQDEKAAMAIRIRDLLRAVHEQAGICHRDVHVGNIVLADDDQPLLIGPKWAVPTVNDHCYDLEGPTASEVDVPSIHVEQGHNGVWWGSDVPHRALAKWFGPPPL